MDFRIYISEILEQWYLYLPLLILFIVLYLIVFRKAIWGIFDPLFVTVVMMGGAAFAVFSLWLNHWADTKYLISFCFTEICLIIGFFISTRFFTKQTYSNKINVLNVNQGFISIFSLIVNIMALALQFFIFSQLGIGLFMEGVNHVSIYDGFGFLKASQGGFSTVAFISFFYKKKLAILNRFDCVVFFILLLAIILSGSKSGILRPISIFFIVEYYFYRRTGKTIAHVKWYNLVILCTFPLLVIVILDNVDMFQAIILFGARLIGSGDIFVMGYNDDVIRHISANSSLQYILYPGWGSILKTIGFSITPPVVIGVDIYDYYYNAADAGPNARLNFLTYYFWGTLGGSFICFLIGYYIGYFRCKYGKYKHNMFVFFVSTILYISILSIISDLNIFLNDFFWTFAVFVVLYFTAQIVYKGITLPHE